ncbi:MAG: zinc-binding dehydrogenase [Spirochaetota bacterium]|nr:MAG: zinc-binding dehydrogenase [Spirochaetota bacterium]
MKAAACMGIKNIKLVDIDKPEPKDDGVLIEVKACGICGSDLHVYNSDLLTEDSTKTIGDHRIIGHEFCGEIVETGKNVTSFRVGDRVASVHNKGGMAEYVEIPGDRLKSLYKLPEDLSYITAATLEPLCNPMHSYHLREPKNDETVAIFGSGAIGLGYLQIVKSYTNAKTIIVDVSNLRLNIAQKFGADIAINARDEDAVKKIKEISGEHYVRYQDRTAGGCDIAIDCAGLALTFIQTMEVLKPEGGTAIIASVYEEHASIDPNIVMLKYLSMYGSMGYYPNETEEALTLIARDPEKRNLLISHMLPLSNVAEGFALQSDPERSVKVIITME